MQHFIPSSGKIYTQKRRQMMDRKLLGMRFSPPISTRKPYGSLIKQRERGETEVKIHFLSFTVIAWDISLHLELEKYMLNLSSYFMLNKLHFGFVLERSLQFHSQRRWSHYPHKISKSPLNWSEFSKLIIKKEYNINY